MINIRWGTVFMFILLVLASCKKPAASEEELTAYINDPANGLRKVVTKDSVVLDLTYLPGDLAMVGKTGTTDLGLDHFNFKITKKGTPPEEHDQIIKYLSKDLMRYVSMRMDSRIIPVEKLVYVPSKSATEGGSVLIIFKSDLINRHSNISIVYDDAMFGTGQTEFIFHIKDLFEVPALK